MRLLLLLMGLLGPVLAQNIEQRRSDLQFITTQIPQRHPNLFAVTPRADFDTAARQLEAQLATASNEVFYTNLIRLLALGRDAHTFISISSPAADSLGFRAFPLQFEFFADGVFLTASSAPWRNFRRARLIAVGGQPIDQVLQQLRTVVSHENEQWFRFFGPRYLRNAGILRGLGIIPSTGPASFTFLLPSGESRTADVTLSTDPLETPFNDPPGYTPVSALNPQDLYFADYWPSSRAIYVAYRVCREMPSFPITALAARIRDLARQPVDTLIFDLRGNTGGNSAFFSQLLSLLQQSLAEQLLGNRRFRAFGLIDRGTFSSGLNAAMDLKRPFDLPPGFGPEDGAAPITILGEPTGGKPASFGEILTATLPGAQLSLQYSTRLIGIPSYISPEDSLSPDIFIPQYSTDYFSRHDATLLAALSRVRAPNTPPSGAITVVNAATFRLESGIAPGSFVAAFGAFPTVPTTITIAGRNVPVLGGNTQQLVLRLPDDLPPGLTQVSSADLRGAFTVTLTGPGIFVTNPADPTQPAAVLNQDSSLNTPSRPARRGEILQIFGTGYPDPPSAQLYLGRFPATVLFSGPNPGIPGLWQINVRIPEESSLSGLVPLSLASGGRLSNGASIRID